MKRKILIIVSWTLVLVWMGVIYSLSNMNGEESTNKSEKTINLVIKKAVEATNDIGITNKNLESKKLNKISKNLDFPLRKLMHVTEYFILTLLLINAFYQSGLKDKKMFIYSLTISILYACSDEIHQAFADRTSSFIDVLIDTCGSLFAVFIIKIIKKFKKKYISKAY